MNLMDLPRDMLEKILTSLNKNDLRSLAETNALFKGLTKKYISAELLREYLESDSLYCCEFNDIFEPLQRPRRNSWKYRRYKILSARSRTIDCLNLG